MSKPILDDLIKRYENNKNFIDENFQDFFQEYIECIKVQKNKGQKKGDRKFTYNCFKSPFMELLKNKGFDVKDEVNLYKPKEKFIILNNLVKTRFLDYFKYKNSKNIDFIAVKGTKKKILFIEVKMTIGTNAMLSGLFELGLINEKKIPVDFEPYFILLSCYTNEPAKYASMFNVLRGIFIEKHLENKCKFVLLDPKKCVNEKEFYNSILS